MVAKPDRRLDDIEAKLDALHRTHQVAETVFDAIVTKFQRVEARLKALEEKR